MDWGTRTAEIPVKKFYDDREILAATLSKSSLPESGVETTGPQFFISLVPS